MANIGIGASDDRDRREQCYVKEVRSVCGVLLRMSRCWVIGMLVLAACGRPGDTRGDASEPSEDETARDPDSDNPTLRGRAMAEWFDERHPALDKPFSIEFRKRMLRTAEQERQRWSTLLPDPKRADLITGTSWTNLGPTKANKLVNGVTLHVTDSGRVRTIIVDGSTIYLATAGGGVWKRTDGVWTPITETIGTLSCGSLAMDPANHDVLYLGLGDPLDRDSTGLGMLKSVDGGATWSAPVFVGFSSVITQVIVDPSDSTIVLAGTDVGLYRSTDAGATFHAVPVGVGLGQVWSIASTGAGSFALSIDLNGAGQVFTSANHGATWTLATGFTSSSGVARITVASAPSNPSIVYGIAATPFFTLADFFKSVDAGRSWTALGVTNTSYVNPNSESSRVGTILGGQGWYSQLVVVSPTDPDTVYWGGQLALAKTTDGGHTFRLVSNWLAQFSLPYVHADHHTATFDASGNLFVGTDGGVFESTDGGTTFTDALNQGVITHLLYSVSSSQNAPDVVLGGMQDDGTRLRVGASSVFDQVIGGDGIGTDVNRTNAQQMLGTTQYLQVQKSTNGGASWVRAIAGITDSGNTATAPFFTRLIPWEGSTTGNEIFTCSLSKIYKSTNYASLWTAVGTIPTSDSIRNLGVAASNINILGVVTALGHVLLSIDGGASWTTASALPGDPWSLSWIHFDVSDPNTIYVASVDTFVEHHLWKSTNFGATWTVIDNGLPANAPVNVIKSDRAPAPGQAGQVLYAGTHMGVYRSTDGGASWSRFGAGMPLVSVMDLYISPDDSLVRAATYGRGFWELSAPTANDFWITASPTNVSVLQGNSGATTLSTLSATGTAETIVFSTSGLPAGATATFSPTSVTAGGSSTVTLAAGRTTPAGTYTVTVTATAPSVTHTQTVSFIVITRPDFSISASPTTVSAVQGNSGTTAVSTAPTAGAHETVALSASGLPAGATATFVPTSVTAGGSSTLTLAAAATTAAGTYTVTITGTAPSAAHTTTVSFVVLARPEFSIGASPATVSVVQRSSASTTVSTVSTAGTPETIALSTSGLPAGATATFVPTSVTAGVSSMLTLAADGATAPGTYTVTVTGTAPSATHTTTVSFVVIARPDFSISASPMTVTIVQGHSDTTEVSTMSAAGAVETIALTAAGLPAGATVAFTPTSVSAGEPSTLTLAADATTAPGTYAIAITGTASSATHTATVSLVVIAKPDFSMTASPAAVSVGQGRSITTAVSTTSTAGEAETIAFSAANVPAGATATFAATGATAGSSSTLTLAADATMPPGTYAMTITGTAPSATHTATVSFVVTADFSISASPTTVSVMQGTAGTIALAIAATGSAADTVVLSASGLPGGVTAAFMPPNITAGSTVILTLTTDANTPEGTYPITVTGAGSAAIHTAPVTLDITATPSQGGGCGCDVDPDVNAMNGALFAMVLGFVVRRRRSSSSLQCGTRPRDGDSQGV